VAFEVADELSHRLRSHASPTRQLGRPRPLRIDNSKDACAVSWANVAEACRRQTTVETAYEGIDQAADQGRKRETLRIRGRVSGS
jgi:hypothetical protein